MILGSQQGPMDIEITHKGTVTVVRLAGRIVEGDPETALQDAFQHLAREDTVRTVVDFEAVTWFDSVAIGLLVAHYISATKRGGGIVLLNADDKIRTLMKMTHLDDRFGWASDLEEASRWLEASS